MVSRRARGRFSVVDLVVDHFVTLRNNETGRPDGTALLIYLGVPAALAVTAWATGTQARHIPEVLGATAILTGLVFNVFVLLFDLTMRAADRSDPARVQGILQLAGELRANISYAVLVGISLTALLGAFVMLASGDELNPIATGFVVFGGVQLLLTIFMALKRVRALYRAFLSSRPDRGAMTAPPDM